MGLRVQEPVIVDLMVRSLGNPDILDLAVGFTSNETLPTEEVSRALSLLAEKTASNPEYLQYGTNQGRPLLRELTANMIAGFANEKIPDLSHNNVLITNGSQQALYLAAQVLCNQGDILFVENPTYFVFLELLRGLGITAISMPTKENGRIDFDKLSLVIDELEEKGLKKRIKGAYFVSYFANPSSRSLPLEDKIAIGLTFKNKDLIIPIIEDAAYRNLYYKHPYAACSMLSLPELKDFPILYLGTYTKPLASGMKIGFGYCNHKEWLNKLLYVKGHHDFGSANFSQALIETFLKEGWFPHHLQRQHEHYGRKAASFHQALIDEKFHEMGWKWDKPEGGLMFWLRGPHHLDTSIGSEFCESCIEEGVLYVPGDLNIAERNPKNCIRAAIGTMPDNRLREAVHRLATVAKLFL